MAQITITVEDALRDDAVARMQTLENVQRFLVRSLIREMKQASLGPFVAAKTEADQEEMATAVADEIRRLDARYGPEPTEEVLRP